MKPKNKSLHKVNWRKDDGMTLVELIASLAILSVVIILVGSVHIFGQRQFINQTESASQANDLSYSLSVMSRELRKAEFDSVTVGAETITVEGGPTFTRNGSRLLQNTSVLSDRIATFAPVLDDVEKSITITINSTGNQQKQSNEYQTTIYFRR